MSEGKSVTLRLSQRERECMDVILRHLKDTFRRADIERNGFATADPDKFVTRALAMRHAIVHTAHHIERDEAEPESLTAA